jgi:hypothetical protein
VTRDAVTGRDALDVVRRLPLVPVVNASELRCSPQAGPIDLFVSMAKHSASVSFLREVLRVCSGPAPKVKLGGQHNPVPGEVSKSCLGLTVAAVVRSAAA